MVKKIEKLTVFFVLAAVSFCGGCGILGVVGTPRQHEIKIPAEYDLTKQKNRKVLVLVEQPGWLSTQVNLRYYLTEAIHRSLMAQVKVKPEYILSYKQLSEFRSSKDDFLSLSPAEVGTALGADVVLLVAIEDYQVSELAESGVYNGFLSVQEALFETATGKKVWPESEENKSIKVNFETGEHGQEAAVERLVSSCAYCTSRYFYNCPKYKFKTFDEQKDIGWDTIGGE